MYQEERLQAILNYLKQAGRISVEEICRRYGVSRDTARRDLVRLAGRGAIIRTHGGAILPVARENGKPYCERLMADIKEKRRIAARAAALVTGGDCVIFDASTTVLACAEQLADLACTVVTNGVDVAAALAAKENITVIMLGGRLCHEHRFVYGAATIDALAGCFADKFFTGAGGLSEHGITVDDDEDAAVTRKMINQSKQVIVLADPSKLEKPPGSRYANYPGSTLSLPPAGRPKPSPSCSPAIMSA